MAKRANQTFFVGTKDGKRMFTKDAVVPADIAKGRDALVYDDGAPAAKKTTAKAD